jgi:hypothetical protein
MTMNRGITGLRSQGRLWTLERDWDREKIIGRAQRARIVNDGCHTYAVTPLLRFNRRTTHEPPASAQSNERSNTEFDGVSNVRLYAYSAVSALMILAAGWVLARTGDSLARQTGLGSSFVGPVLIVYSTGLVGLYAMP